MAHGERQGLMLLSLDLLLPRDGCHVRAMLHRPNVEPRIDSTE